MDSPLYGFRIQYPIFLTPFIIPVMTQNGPAIQCIDLLKTFGPHTVLQNVSFQVAPGQIVALVGQNGAGKTTLIKILASLVKPTGGKALIRGYDIIKESIQAKSNIGFVPSEERSFYWRLTGRQNLRFFASLHNIHGKASERRVDSALEAVGLGGEDHVCFKEYSSGMKQALGIARGILHDPRVLLLDEPTRSLSPDVAMKIRRLMRHQARKEGKTILISSHNLIEVEELADRIVVLRHGIITAIGSLSDLKTLAGSSPATTLETLFEHFTHGA